MRDCTTLFHILQNDNIEQFKTYNNNNPVDHHLMLKLSARFGSYNIFNYLISRHTENVDWFSLLVLVVNSKNTELLEYIANTFDFGNDLHKVILYCTKLGMWKEHDILVGKLTRTTI